MGVDPVSMLVAALLVAALVKRVPGIVAGLAETASQGQSGEDDARAERLKGAGFEPASGSPVGRFFGNLWRDAWLDLDEKRQASRDTRKARSAGGGSDGGRSWLDRLGDKMDAKVTDVTDRWRRGGDGQDVTRRDTPGGDAPGWDPPDDRDGQRWPRDPAEPPPVAGDGDPLPPVVPPETAGDPPARPDRDDEAPLPPPRRSTDPATPPPFTPEQPWTFTGGSQARGHTDPAVQQARGPAVGTLERDDQQPHPSPPVPVGAAPTVIEGEVVSALARTAVTGVVSGAAEARGIQRAVDEANAAYIAAMARIRARIVSLGEQTLSEVQMAGKSDVVQRTAQAAEAAAAAQAHARSVGNEVGPLLGAVARAFDRRNS